MQRFAVQTSFSVIRPFLRFICGKNVKKNVQIRAECEKISTYSRQLVGFIVQIRCWNNVLSYTSKSKHFFTQDKKACVATLFRDTRGESIIKLATSCLLSISLV